MTNKQLRGALLERLGVTPQAVSQRVKKLKRRYAMTTEDATYLIAQQEGIILDKYLDKETIDRIRGLLQQIPSRIEATAAQTKATPRVKERARKEQRVIIIGKEFEVTDPILPQKKILEAKEMAAIYPFLYILENSIRAIIDRIMTSRHGDGWWDSEAPRGLRDVVSKRMADEKKEFLASKKRRSSHRLSRP